MNNRRQELAQERYDDECLIDMEPEACQKLAHAFWGVRDMHLLYLQVGCDADDFGACSGYTYHLCITYGECGAEAKAVAYKVLGLRPDGGSWARYVLGTIYCQEGQALAANRYFEESCALDFNHACAASC